MVLTKEHQEAMVNKYFETHTAIETEAFMDGMNAVVELLNKQRR
tara:strand:- start:499 stop:630 length:132 start_codon:yes stop_codon:yes gene_type:complete